MGAQIFLYSKFEIFEPRFSDFFVHENYFHCSVLHYSIVNKQTQVCENNSAIRFCCWLSRTRYSTERKLKENIS